MAASDVGDKTIHGSAAPTRRHAVPMCPSPNAPAMTGWHERRQCEPIAIILRGRYMLPDGPEYKSDATHVSAPKLRSGTGKRERSGNASSLISAISVRIEGIITRRFHNAFAIAVHASSLKRGRLATQIKRLAKHQTFDVGDQRQSQRVIVDEQFTKLRTSRGRRWRARFITLSILGASLEVAASPPIGSPVTIGHTAGYVARHLCDGLAVMIDSELSAQRFQEFTTLSQWRKPNSALGQRA